MAMTLEERTRMMVREYGEVCSKAQAGRIISRTSATIKRMIADGRLEAACAGTMVDVRSIARFIDEPEKADFEARKRKLKFKYNSEFAV